MAELDLLRSLPTPISGPSDEARARARARFMRHIERTPPVRRRLVLVPAVVLAAAVAVAAFASIGGRGTSRASAAPLLQRMASVASVQKAGEPLTAGHFEYSKWIVGYLSGGAGWYALSPGVRESWLAPNGSGYLHERWNKPTFPTHADRAAWIAAGRPQVNPREDSGKLPPSPRRHLPTDPDELYATIHDSAVGRGNSTDAEMFTLVADALRDPASPELRAALYDVAARIPGVALLGPATDRLGRHGVAVASVDGKIHERHELIFDPRTSALLGEEYTELDGNPYDYPAGTVTGYATYAVSAVVDRIGARR
ncbi:MAG: CU044_5270 family protein [Gaiellaceae bacterium]